MTIKELEKKTLEELILWIGNPGFHDLLTQQEQKQVRVSAERLHSWLHEEQTGSYIEHLNGRINKGMDYLISAMELGKSTEQLKSQFKLWHELSAKKLEYLDEGWLENLTKKERLEQMRALENK